MSTTSPHTHAQVCPFGSSVSTDERVKNVNRLTADQMAVALDITMGLQLTVARRIAARINRMLITATGIEAEMLNHTLTRYKERFNL